MAVPCERLADFLLLLAEEGKQLSTIKNYRSAISAIHQGFPDGTTVGTNDVIAKLLKGLFFRIPRSERLAPKWSINDVLAALAATPYEPMSNAPLEALTHKTLFLVVAASARRRGYLHALSVRTGFLRFDSDGVRLLPNAEFSAKNQTDSFTPKPIFLPKIDVLSSVSEDRVWCPVRALHYYVRRTRDVRTSDQLFILPRSPYTRQLTETPSRDG